MIEIVDYQPDWPIEFDRLAAKLKTGLGPLALRIDHIGSTAVPGLAAKDIIDVQVTVRELSSDVALAIEGCGFVRHPTICRDHIPPGSPTSESDWKKFFFTEPPGQRRANIHIRRVGCPNQHFALLVRDYLRDHPASAAAYAELKRRLAGSLADDRTYPDVKDPASDLIYFAAKDWAANA